MPVSRNAVSGNSAPVSDNSIPKLDRKYTHIVNNDASVGLNGVPGQHEVSDTTRGNAFLEGMSNVFNTVGNAVGQGVNKLKQALVSSGNASWFGGEEQKAAAEQALREEEAANREAINEYRDYRNTLKEEHPIAYGAGDFLTKSQLYRGAGGLGAATGAEAALSGKIGETGANLALGQAADVLLDTIPTEIENYQNGMRGTDLATDTLKNLGVNAAFNLGAEGLGMIPGLLKGMRKPTEEVAEEAVETAAKSAPVDEVGENAIKQLEPIAEPEPIKQLNPVDLAARDAEVEELAYRQQREALGALDDLTERIPPVETPAQPVTDLVNSQTVENLADTVKPVNDVNRSELQGITDSIINARNTQDLVGNGNSEAGREYIKTVNNLQKQEANIMKQAEKIDDPTVRQLYDEVANTGDAYWDTILNVRNPINPEAVNVHRQALENLENYMNNNTRQSLTDSLKGLEIDKTARKDIRNSLKNMDGMADRIRNAQSAEEVNAILSEAEKMAGDTDELLKRSAGIREIKKGDFDEPTQAFVDALNGKKIYLSPEVRANFTDMKNINDFGNALYFNGNGGRFKPAFRATNKNATAIDAIFPEIDREAGYAISNYMKANGLNPDNAADQVRGLLDYGNYLKSNKDSLKVRPYEGGILDDFMGNLRNAAEDKLNTFKEAVTPEPRLKPNLQFFADKAEEARRTLESMPEGAEKEQFRDSLEAFEAKLRNAKSVDEAQQAWELSKVRKTMEKSGIFTEDELKNVIPEEDLKYMRQGEEVPYNAVKKRIADDYNGMLTRYTQKFDSKEAAVKELGNAEDINGMYIMAKDRLEKARATDNMAEKRVLYAEARGIMLNCRKANTELGRAIQANAKVARTPERSVMDALGYAEEKVSKALEKDPNLKKGIEQVTEQIDNFLKDMDTAAMNREEVENMINQALLQNKRVRQRISKGDVQKIADAILEDKQYCDIQKQLEFLSTGVGDVDAKTMDQVQQMFEAVQDLPFNSKKRVDMENEAYKLLATTISPKGGSFRDKFDAWRYLAMLANPTTHIKNMTGNVLFGQGMVSIKNNLAALIEGAANKASKVKGNGGIERTKALLSPKDSALIKAAKEDGLENAFRELSGNKYLDAGTSIDQAIPAFNTKTALGRFLNKASEINAGALSKEDEMAMLSKYQTSLAGYLKANGADANIFKATDEESKALLENARTYAINQAKEAAFHQDNATADLFSQATRNFRDSDSKVAKGVGLAADVIVPFKKTPANILKSAFEYSPLEYAKVITDINALNKGTIKAADFIDDISKATTGTAALGIGALLAHEGILKIGSDLSDEEESFDKQTGRQTVSIKVGDKYVPIQELIPAAAPLIFGGTIYETMANKTDGDTALNTLFAGTGAIANGVIDMSMLSGITDTLKSVRGAKDSKEVITNLAIKTASNLASQLVPTIGRKANVTIDDTKRSTYSDKTGAAKQIDQNIKYLQTKVPGLQQLGETLKESDIPALQKVGNRLALEPNVDVKGQVQESPGHAGINNIGGRAINNFLSPVNVTKDTSTKYDEERRRLEKATGETKVLPYIATDESKIDDVPLSPSDWTEYRKTRGQLRESLAEGIIDSPTYKDLSDEDKAALLVDADSFSKAYAQSKYGKEMKSENKKLAAIYEKDDVKGVIDSLNTKVQLDKYGLDNTDKNRERLAEFSADKMKYYAAYKEKESAYKNSNGIEDLKNTDRAAVLRKMPLSAQKELIPEVFDSQTDKQRWNEVNGDVNKFWASYDKAQKQARLKQVKKEQDQKAQQTRLKQLNINNADQVQKELSALGVADKVDSVEKFAHAKQALPSMTLNNYADYVKKMARGDGDICQTDVIKYANQNHFSQKEMDTYWKAFTNTTKTPKLSKKGNWYVR
jgi:hypothetical protein